MWLDLLKQAVDAPGASQASVAKALGYASSTVVSLALSGKYPAKTDKIEARVLAVFGRVQCPHLGEELSGAQCIEYHTRAAPTSSPFAMRHWRACQSCPNRRKP